MLFFHHTQIPNRGAWSVVVVHFLRVAIRTPESIIPHEAAIDPIRIIEEGVLKSNPVRTLEYIIAGMGDMM